MSATAAVAILSTSTTSPNMPSPPSTATNVARPVRPKFNSQNTQDRLREGEGLHGMLFRTDSNLQKGRRSVFKETGLDDDPEFSDVPLYSPPPAAQEPPSFPSRNGHAQGLSVLLAKRQKSQQMKPWYVFDALFQCLGL